MLFGIAIYIVIHIATYFLFVHVLGKNHLKNINNEAVNKSPFFRNDLKNWGLIRNFPFILTFWPRFISGCLNVAFYTIWIMVFMIGADRNNISKTRKFFIRYMGFFCVRLFALQGGCYWVNLEYVSTGEGDYKKWLGPDWKPQWTGAGTIVANHVCWLDILVSMAYFFPSFLSKKSV